MKNKLLIIGGVVALGILFSCKKEDNSQISSNETVYDNYMPLKLGNYWVYKYNELDSVGNNITSVTKFDTITIIGKETINGKEYYKSGSSNPSSNFRVYFSGWIRNDKGKLLGPKVDSLNNFLNEENVIFDLQLDSLNKLQCTNFAPFTNCEIKQSAYNLKRDSSLNTSAGNFKTKVVQYYHWVQFGIPFWGSSRTTNQYYSKDVGLIRKEIFAFSSSGTIFWELVDYKLL